MVLATISTLSSYAAEAVAIKYNVESLIHEVNVAYNFLLFCNTIDSQTIVCAKIKTKFINARAKLHLFINTIAESTILIKLFEKAQAYVLGKNQNIEEDMAEIENIVQTNIKQKLEESQSTVPKSFKEKLWKSLGWVSDKSTKVLNIYWVSRFASYYRTELNILVTIMNTIATEILNSRISHESCSNIHNILSVSGQLLRKPTELIYKERSSRSGSFRSTRSSFSRSGSFRSARSSFSKGGSSRKRK
jgi:uncharacterized membrane protein YgcG